ncbi:MAG: hypothetical protein IPJ64_13100 [Saprospiraceae bacterium]|nr:hypothetical protein [Saprospiraceae bacterium]
MFPILQICLLRLAKFRWLKNQLIIFTLILFSLSLSYAQTDSIQILKTNEIKDTNAIVTKKSSSNVLKILFAGKPGRALAYSLIIPGAGQVYNKKYWKVPVVYGALGVSAYLIYQNQKEYNRYDNAFESRVMNKSNPIDEFKNSLSLEGIVAYKNYYDKNLQRSKIALVICYLLNGIDAFVDRHLMTFNVSDDLSLELAPAQQTQMQAGLALNLKWK